MADHALTLKSTRRLVAGDALKAVEASESGRIKNKKAGVPQEPVATNDARLARAEFARLDSTLRASIALRQALRAEISAVRGGIVIAADASRAVAQRLGGIHHARRGLKRVRALIGLTRGDSKQSMASAREAIRLAKAALADSRQRDALALLLEELCALKGNPLTTVKGHGVSCALDAPLLSTLGEALLAVEVVERSCHIPSGSTLDWHDVAEAFGENWQSARNAAHSEWLGRSDEWLHSTRKKFQRTSDQLAALRACTPARIQDARKQLRVAAEQLGRARDLALLADTIDSSTVEGKALSRRALSLRSDAVRQARDGSCKALKPQVSEVRMAIKRGAGIARQGLR